MKEFRNEDGRYYTKKKTISWAKGMDVDNIDYQLLKADIGVKEGAVREPIPQDYLKNIITSNNFELGFNPYSDPDTADIEEWVEVTREEGERTEKVLTKDYFESKKNEHLFDKSLKLKIDESCEVLLKLIGKEEFKNVELMKEFISLGELLYASNNQHHNLLEAKGQTQYSIQRNRSEKQKSSHSKAQKDKKKRKEKVKEIWKKLIKDKNFTKDSEKINNITELTGLSITTVRNYLKELKLIIK